MPVLFLHGVPATAALWKPILARIDRDDEVLAPDLPGFAADPPDGWIAVKESYVDWVIELIERLHARGGPVHVVGHDWGCLLALRAASLRPELLRSIAVGNAPIDPHWPLHMLWTEWMIDGRGEKLADQLAEQNPMEDTLLRLGFAPEDARHNAFVYPGNARRILLLYRSAARVGQEWAQDLANIVVPAMFIWGERDIVVPVEIGRRMAARVGAEFVTLDADHFWPVERPEEAAALLRRLWQRAELRPYTILTQPPFGS